MLIKKIPTALEGSTRADAAARRARGRQAESTKEGGWGERERVVERPRVSVLINCIGRLYASSEAPLRAGVTHVTALSGLYSATFPPSLLLFLYLHFLL